MMARVWYMCSEQKVLSENNKPGLLGQKIQI